MRRLILVLVVSLCACDEVTQPLDHATEMRTLPSEYAGWWREVELCSGLAFDMKQMTFFEYAGDIPGEGLGDKAGLAEVETRRIFFAHGQWRSKNVVQHEALHILTLAHGVGRSDVVQEVWGRDHPSEYFGVHHYTGNSWTQGGKCSALLNEWDYLPSDRQPTW